MKTIEGECCRDCLVLAKCKNKKQYNVLSCCHLIRLQLYEFGCDWVEKYGPTHINIIPLDMKFCVQKSTEKGKYMVSGDFP